MTRIRIARAGELAYRQLPGRLSANPLEGADVGQVSIRVVHLDAGPRAPHRHPRSLELIHVLAGEGTFWQDGETARVGPGDLVVVPAGAAHATIPDAEMDLYCVFPLASLAGEVEELEGEIVL